MIEYKPTTLKMSALYFIFSSLRSCTSNISHLIQSNNVSRIHSPPPLLPFFFSTASSSFTFTVFCSQKGFVLVEKRSISLIYVSTPTKEILYLIFTFNKCGEVSLSDSLVKPFVILQFQESRLLSQLSKKHL